jgi:uncharacterized protein YndB with AHSA1/START domain
MAMAGSADKTIVCVTHRFSASAERVYDAFLDPARAGRFLFATATGHIVRCEIDARVGGTFTIVDRRGGEDVAHTGEYVTLERPRLIVFTLTVEQYSSERSTVTIEIAPLGTGCEVTLTHEMTAVDAPSRDRTEDGWRAILDVAAEILVDEAPTCGVGIAQHASGPAQIGVMFSALAETLELHRTMLVLDDPNAREEDAVYRDLAERWARIATLVTQAAAAMSAQHDLPMGAHDETKWTDAHLRAFEKFVKGQSRLLSLLRANAERDEAMLASMREPG